MTPIRSAILVLTVLQTGITTYLGFGDYVPQSWRVALVVASAMVSVALNQLPRWQQEGDGGWMSSPKPPRG